MKALVIAYTMLLGAASQDSSVPGYRPLPVSELQASYLHEPRVFQSRQTTYSAAYTHMPPDNRAEAVKDGLCTIGFLPEGILLDHQYVQSDLASAAPSHRKADVHFFSTLTGESVTARDDLGGTRTSVDVDYWRKIPELVYYAYGTIPPFDWVVEIGAPPRSTTQGAFAIAHRISDSLSVEASFLVIGGVTSLSSLFYRNRGGIIEKAVWLTYTSAIRDTSRCSLPNTVVVASFTSDGAIRESTVLQNTSPIGGDDALGSLFTPSIRWRADVTDWRFPADSIPRMTTDRTMMLSEVPAWCNANYAQSRDGSASRFSLPEEKAHSLQTRDLLIPLLLVLFAALIVLGRRSRGAGASSGTMVVALLAITPAGVGGRTILLPPPEIEESELRASVLQSCGIRATMDDVHSHLVSVLAGLPRRRLLVGSTDVLTPNAELDFLPTASSYGIAPTECSACIAARSKQVTLSEWRGSRPPELQASAGAIELVRQGLTDYASGSTKLTWAPREIGADDDHVIEVSEIELEALSACSAYVSFSPNHTTAGKGWILTVIWDLSNPVDPNDAHVLVAPQSQPEAMVTIPLEFKGVRGLGLAHETLELKGLNAYTSLEHTLPSGITGHVSVLETSTCVHSSVSVVDGVMHVQTRETPDACAYHICGRSVLLRIDRGPSLTPLYERVAFEHSPAHKLRAEYWLTITRFGTEVIQLFERPDGGILPYYPERLPYTYEALLACGWQKRVEIAAGSDDVDWHVVELADQPSRSPIRIIETTENDSIRLAWTRAAFGSLR